MTHEDFKNIFTQNVLEKLFPKDRTDQFFDALFGGAEEGAYDISLQFKGNSDDRLEFEFHLNQRPGKCLACHLTQGLPQVFSRHPILNLRGIVKNICELLNGKTKCMDYQLGRTQKYSKELHVIPFTIFLNQ